MEYQPHRDEAEKADAEVPEIKRRFVQSQANENSLLKGMTVMTQYGRNNKLATYTGKKHNPAWAQTFDKIH